MVAPVGNPFGKAELKYPVIWSFRVIAVAEKADAVAASVRGVMALYKIKKDLVLTSKSRSGAYQTMTFDAEIFSHDEMESLDSALKKIDGVKVVI